MARLYGADYSRDQLESLCPGLSEMFAVTPLRRDDGQRVLQIDSGGGLRIDLLPDRCCDLGAVWCDGVPFFWSGPAGPVAAPAGANTPLYGLMQTCGFDHIRQPETHEGRAYTLHGGMLHRPARILRAGPVWDGDDCTLVIEAEVAQFALDRGGLRLSRRIEVDLGGRGLRLRDRVTVTAGVLPIMAMYHINLGFPVFGPGATLHQEGQDITGHAMERDAIVTRPSGDGPARVRLAAAGGGPSITVAYDGGALPVLQTLCDTRPGIGLFCIEPATHARQGRADLGAALIPSGRGDGRDFALDFTFDPGG